MEQCKINTRPAGCHPQRVANEFEKNALSGFGCIPFAGGNLKILCRISRPGGDMLSDMTANDLDLLRQFARDHSQDAFTALVKRHVNLVYSAALRQVRAPQLAEEIAQSVFADLARDAGKLQ